MDQNRREEAAALEEMEIALKQLRSAYMAVINTFTRVAKNPELTVNPTETELIELETARKKFNKAQAILDKIAEEIRWGIRK
jgi:hypothetical protein